MKKTKIGFFTVATLVIIGGIANATTMSQTEQYLQSGSNQEIPWQPNEFPTLTFNKFNTSLGTLTAIDVLLTARVSGDINGKNISATSQRVNGYSLNAEIAFDGVPDIAPPDNIVLVSSVVGGTQSIPAGNSATYTVPPASLSYFHSVLGSGFSLYEGSGTFDIKLSPYGYYTWGSQSGVDVSADIFAGAAVKIDYIYDTPTAPVPEPATMLLFGTGLVGLAAARRRKKAC